MEQWIKGTLTGKTALVTGGSRGLGKWISVILALKGAVVAVNYANNETDARQTVDLIQSKGGKAFIVQGDVTDENQVMRLVDEVNSRADKGINILVNNATGPQPRLSIEDSTWEDYLDQLHFFTKAPLLLIKAILPKMKKNQSGSIINIGSEAVQVGNANLSSYVTAKSAMIGMTRSWANELGPHGIRVNLVNPGFIPVEKHEDIEEAVFEQYKKSVALRKMGDPSDIGDAVAFLASDESKFITGQSLSVNGGKNFGI